MICIGWKDDRDEAELRSEPRLLLILGDCLTVCDSVRLQNNVGILYALSVSIIIIFRSRRLTPEFGHELIVCIVLPEPFIRLQLLAPKVDKVIVELFLSGRCVFVWHLVLCGSINAPYELSIPECLVEVDVVTTVRIRHSYRCLLEGGLEGNRAKFNRNVESFMLSDRRVNIVGHKAIAVPGRQRLLADHLGQNHNETIPASCTDFVGCVTLVHMPYSGNLTVFASAWHHRWSRIPVKPFQPLIFTRLENGLHDGLLQQS